jgi:hypothetical protein
MTAVSLCLRTQTLPSSRFEDPLLTGWGSARCAAEAFIMSTMY